MALRAALVMAVFSTLVLGFVPPSTAALVSFLEKVDLRIDRFRVNDAEGLDESEAVGAAKLAVVAYAAKTLTGDEEEKRQVGEFVQASPAAVLPFAGQARIVRRIFQDEGDGIVVSAIVDVDMAGLRGLLEEMSVIKRTADLAEGVGNPTLLLVYSGLEGHTAHRELTQLGQVVTDRVTEFFTARQWNVLDRKAEEQARARTEAMGAAEGLLPDPTAQLAMMAGADIYVLFSLIPGGSGVQVSASVKAYETTSGRMLAAATGQSRQYMPGTAYATAMSEALSDCMPKVFEDISGYWHDDVKKGRRIIVKLNGDFSDRNRYRAVRDVLKELGEFKKTVKTQASLAGVIRTTMDPDDVTDDLEDGIKAAGVAEVRFLVEQPGLLILNLVDPPAEAPPVQ